MQVRVNIAHLRYGKMCFSDLTRIRSTSDLTRNARLPHNAAAIDDPPRRHLNDSGRMVRVVALLALFGIVGGTAAAENVPVVNLEANGPSQEIPTRSSFYPQGPAKAAVRVSPMIAPVL